MGFSSILDISSFFIGMIINLIFVALMCYYFKRKYDYLYEAQCEQSKIIYQLLRKPSTETKPSCCATPSLDFTCDPLVHVKSMDTESNHDTDSESESDEESEPEESESKTIEFKSPDPTENTFHISVEEVKVEEPLDITVQDITLQFETDPVETNYSKMSMKQLKDVLSSKGIKPKPNIKKDELIELITKDSA